MGASMFLGYEVPNTMQTQEYVKSITIYTPCSPINYGILSKNFDGVLVQCSAFAIVHGQLISTLRNRIYTTFPVVVEKQNATFITAI